MNQYDCIDTLEEEDLEGEYKCIGEGSSRRVYALDDYMVVKVAKDDIGYSQNMTEYRIYKGANEEERQVLAPVIDESRGGYMILMRRAKVENQDVDEQSLYILNEIITKHELLEEDLISPDSWGIIDSQVVCIDYGCTKSIRNKYDDTMIWDSEYED